jgi:hypothetical protein
MRPYLPVLLMAAAAHAAVIRGAVVENQTGKPLARTVVTLQPVAGTRGTAQTIRANNTGGFQFDSLAPGSYVLTASRTGFIPIEYGQKRWNSCGTPVVLEEDSAPFLNLRLLRYSAIQGTVVDENDVGLPDHHVIAYRNTKPPVPVAEAITDDRGAYRLHGLPPGTYAVSTAGKRYDDETYLPTFATEAHELEQSRTVELTAEQDAEHADIRPFPNGRLFNLTVIAPPPLAGMEITLTIASELGRKSVKAEYYRFTELPPGEYDLYAEVAADPNEGRPAFAAYQRMALGRDSSVSLVLAQGGSRVTVEGAAAADPGKLWVRRKDLAGVGESFSVPLARGGATLLAGRWEVLLEAPSGYYVSGFSTTSAAPQATVRADGWNEVLTRNYALSRFTVASGPGAIRGAVRRSGDPVAAAPVYLEGYDPVARTRVTDLRTVRADARGQYYFGGLAPGTYRVLGTFEYLAPDVQTMDLAGAPLVTITAHTEAPLDLDLYVIQ